MAKSGLHDLLSVKQAAAELGITPRRVLALIESGRLRSRQLGREHAIDRADLRAVRDRKPGRPAGKKSGK